MTIKLAWQIVGRLTGIALQMIAGYAALIGVIAGLEMAGL